MRSAAQIRADLEHPHAAALTAFHSTTIGDGPIGRLLRDVQPLLDRVEAAEARIAAVEATLAELVRLKDGPRDDAYRAAKETAWSAARAVLAASPTPTGPEREPERSHLGGWAKGNLQFHLIWDHGAHPTDVPYDGDLDAIHRRAHEPTEETTDFLNADPLRGLPAEERIGFDR